MSAAFVRYADRTGAYAAVALGFSIPVSVALDNLLVAVVLLSWFAGGAWRNMSPVIAHNRVATASLILFGVLAAGVTYGQQSFADARDYLGKYSDLALIPVFIYVFRDARLRRLGVHAFAASIGLTLILSLLIKLGFVGTGAAIKGDSVNPVVFKERITHGLLMALGAYLFALQAMRAGSLRARYAWGVLAGLAAMNVLFMTRGVSGYVVMLLLMVLLVWVRFGRKGVATGFLGATLLAAALFTFPGPFQTRVISVIDEIAESRPGVASETSAGLRLEFYRNTLGIVAQHPVFGVGTGGFPLAYADRVRDSELKPTRNPHNEYLHIAAQTGMIGLAVLLWLFWSLWRNASRLATPLETELARGLVLMFVAGCLFNSLLLDHTEGLLFAWLTGLLYAGVQSSHSPTPDAA